MCRQSGSVATLLAHRKKGCAAADQGAEERSDRANGDRKSFDVDTSNCNAPVNEVHGPPDETAAAGPLRDDALTLRG